MELIFIDIQIILPILCIFLCFLFFEYCLMDIEISFAPILLFFWSAVWLTEIELSFLFLAYFCLFSRFSVFQLFLRFWGVLFSWYVPICRLSTLSNSFSRFTVFAVLCLLFSVTWSICSYLCIFSPLNLYLCFSCLHFCECYLMQNVFKGNQSFTGSIRMAISGRKEEPAQWSF